MSRSNGASAESTIASSSSPSKTPPTQKSYLSISLQDEAVVLRGRNADVDSAILSGHVEMFLIEPLAIKEISLNFRGKAKLPVSSHEALSQNPTSMSYNLCNHDWSFLAGKKSHNHTLKAGRHLFPFQLELGGSLPASLTTMAMGGATIQYRLRATAARPGFAHNLQAFKLVNVIRGLKPEAIEYQQTLQIESTWPEKIMYSIMIPHKAWAIGEDITALMKLSPIAKGAKVVHCTSTLVETTRIPGKYGAQEDNRTISTAKYDINGHDAILIEESHFQPRTPLLGSTTTTSTPSPTAVAPSNPLHMTTDSYFAPRAEPRRHRNAQLANVSAPEGDTAILQSGVDAESNDVVTTISVNAGSAGHPSTTLDPVVVSHRIRWSILIRNMEGHVSELKCSLPIMLLNATLLEEAQQGTALTRQLLLGDAEDETEPDSERELPSYREHVQDRVADPYVDSGYNTPFISAPGTPEIEHADLSQRLMSLSVNGGGVVEPRREEPTNPQSSLSSTYPSRSASPDHLLHRVGAMVPDIMTHIHDTVRDPIPAINSIGMKPLTSIHKPAWLPSRSTSSSSLSSMAAAAAVAPPPLPRPIAQSRSDTAATVQPPLTRSYSDVPNYQVAARAIMPPLSSSDGLPTYDQARIEVAAQVL